MNRCPTFQLAYSPCSGDPEIVVDGYVGGESSKRSDDQSCVVKRITWATQCWEQDEFPAIGEQVSLEDDWYVSATDRYGCTGVLELCRAVVECPDCLAIVYGFARDTATLSDCQEAFDPEELYTDVPCTVCVLESSVMLENDAEIQRQRVLLCLEGVELDTSMIVNCGTNNYRVTKVRQKCSAGCLTTVEAELDTLGIMESL